MDAFPKREDGRLAATIAPDLRLEASASPRLLCAIRGLVRGYLANLGCPGDTIDQAVLAVDEACANAVRHAYCGDPAGVLELTLAADPGRVEMILRDNGTPIDPRRLERKRAAKPSAATVRPGGLGIPIIFETFDEACILPGAEQGNDVVMRLNRSAPGGGEAN
jgi:anti-sigma regulatory factor (Ser/Thr protein kinase)